MSSIGVLGFIVWAHDGLFTSIISKLNSLYAKMETKSLNQQATLNSSMAANINNKGASEATREWIIHNDFRDFVSIGFSEGDGSWGVSQNRPTFIIRQKYPEVLYYIKENLKFGEINLYSDGYYNYSVTNWEDSKKLALLFNGNLILNKTRIRFEAYYNLIHNKFPDLPFFIDKPAILSLNNGWISGFTQADGGFNIQIKKRKNVKLGYQIRLRFYLDQKGELEVLNLIKKVFNTGGITVRDGNNQLYRYSTYGYTPRTIGKVVTYFKNYPVMFQKNESFKTWIQVYNILNEGPLTEEGLEKIKKIIYDLRYSPRG